MRPFVLILSSPSGGGKTTIARALLRARDDIGYSVSVTTRAPREGEQDGVDYYFVTPEEFDGLRARGKLLEWAEYGGQLYGTLEEQVEDVLAEGRHVLLDIEVAGARQIRERRDDVVSIFILPPSARALWDRLGGRSSEDAAAARRRMLRASEEVAAALEYDFVVINADRSQAVADVAAIIDAEGRRAARLPELGTLLATLQRDLAEIGDELAAQQE